MEFHDVKLPFVLIGEFTRTSSRHSNNNTSCILKSTDHKSSRRGRFYMGPETKQFNRTTEPSVWSQIYDNARNLRSIYARTLLSDYKNVSGNRKSDGNAGTTTIDPV